MKIFFIASSCYTLYLMKFKHRPTHDPSIDTFRVEYLVGPCVLLALIFNYKFAVSEILWSFSIFAEAVAILPQLFMLQRTGEAETITTHYLAALGAYRALYVPNWIYRCAAIYLWPPSLVPTITSTGTFQKVLSTPLQLLQVSCRLGCTWTSSMCTSQSAYLQSLSRHIHSQLFLLLSCVHTLRVLQGQKFELPA